MSVYTKTTNGETCFISTGSANLNFFFNVGSSRNSESIKNTFSHAVLENPELATAILLWARNPRGGCGERGTFRKLCNILIESEKKLATKVIHLIPTFGRFDDLKTFWGTSLENVAHEVWSGHLMAGNALAFKWVDRSYKNLREFMGFVNEASFRKFISKGRKDTVVEQKMCRNAWSQIDYQKIPSLSGIRYANAFTKNDNARYVNFITNKDTKVNATVAYPYDVYKMIYESGAKESASKYWKNLPQLDIVGSILPMIDVSGSMSCASAGKLTCMQIAVSLGAYISQQIKGPFKDKFMTFSSHPEIIKLPQTDNIVDIFESIQKSNWGYDTNIESAFKVLLHDALRNGIKSENLPSHILILSDMQFNEACSQDTGSLFSDNDDEKEGRPIEFIENMRKEYESYGYALPKIVFWNLNAQYDNFPSTKNKPGICMVSGFSPYVLKSVLSSKYFTPIDIMTETVQQYLDLLTK